ncbi:MAG: hypothetical protein H8E35_04730 [Ardenticatenia bacterium]|nr:hypothetical protein [Ardenticatenia bacterium]
MARAEPPQRSRILAGAGLDAGEFRPVILVAVLIVAISCLPYLVGYLAAPPAQVFGGFVLDEIDSNTYLAIMQQGVQGQWSATLLYTPEDHPPAIMYVFYLALGHVAAGLGLPLILAYHVARIGCALILLVSLYLFLALFLKSKRERWTAYLLAATGSGIGWLVVALAGNMALAGVSPIDFWLMEAYVFFTLFLFPHSALAMALLMGILGAIVTYFREEGDVRSWLLALGSGLALALVNPYVLMIAGLILAAYAVALWGVRGRVPPYQGLALAALGLVFAVLLVTYPLQLNLHPVGRSFLTQNIMPSPPLLYYAAGYGLIFALALPGAWHVLKRRNEGQWLLIAWPVSAFLASYLPMSGQRRMIFGAVIPLAALAAIGLQRTVLPNIQQSRLADWLLARDYSRQRLGGLITALTVALASISNLLLLSGSTVSAATAHPSMTQPAAVEEAIAWLGQHSPADAVVLSSYRVGNLIPARIGRRVVWGHWAQTAFYDQKRVDVTAFFDSSTSSWERQSTLARYGVDCLFYGPQEQSLGHFNPNAAAYLEEMFRNQMVTIYRVSTD